MTIGERIRYLRKSILKIKSSEEFGGKIGISGSNMRSIENSRVNATDRVISDICTTFDVNEDWLRNGGSDEKIFVKLSHNEEIEKYTQSLLNSSDDILINMVKEFIIIYEKLDEESKLVLKNFARKLSNNLSQQHLPVPVPDKKSIDERVEDYRRQLEAEEKVEEKSSVLRKKA